MEIIGGPVDVPFVVVLAASSDTGLVGKEPVNIVDGDVCALVVAYNDILLGGISDVDQIEVLGGGNGNAAGNLFRDGVGCVTEDVCSDSAAFRNGFREVGVAVGVDDFVVGFGVVVDEVQPDFVDLVGLQLDGVDVLGAGGVIDPDELAFVADCGVVSNGVQDAILRRVLGREDGAVLGNLAQGHALDLDGFVFTTAARAEAEHQAQDSQQGRGTIAFHKAHLLKYFWVLRGYTFHCSTDCQNCQGYFAI